MKKPAVIAQGGLGYLFTHAAAFIGAACCCPGNTPGLLRGGILYHLSGELNSPLCNFFCERYPCPAPLYRLACPWKADPGSLRCFGLGLSLYQHQAGGLNRGGARHAQELDEGAEGLLRERGDFVAN